MNYKDPNDLYPVRPISPDDGYHYFFGYYDLNAYHISGKYHLANRVEFMDRLPEKDDVCTLGRINIETREFEPFAETTAWNFQQGALLTYNVANYDEVFYNVRKGDEYVTCIHNLETGEKRYTDRACANISLDGKRGLAVNFNRIYDFRPGYGYAGVKDPWYDIPTPEDDGVFLVDMETGKSKLLVSTAEMLRQFPNPDLDGCKFVVNHITFSPSGEQYMFLLRNFGKEGRKWTTSLIIGDLQGNVRNVIPYTVISHYHWKDEVTMLVYARINGEEGIGLLNTVTGEFRHFDDPHTHWDLHCLYSPDRKCFIGDTYPDKESRRPLYICDPETGKSKLLLREYSAPASNTDIRCDLHNRWNPQGTKFSWDTTRNGKREILEMDLCEELGK